jgi:hypothetical protein
MVSLKEKCRSVRIYVIVGFCLMTSCKQRQDATTLKSKTFEVVSDSPPDGMEYRLIFSENGDAHPNSTIDKRRFVVDVSINNQRSIEYLDSVHDKSLDFLRENFFVMFGKIERVESSSSHPWKFKLNANTVGFAERMIEVCDASISYIQENLDSWLEDPGTNGIWCPWLSNRFLNKITRKESRLQGKVISIDNKYYIENIELDISKFNFSAPELIFVDTKTFELYGYFSRGDSSKFEVISISIPQTP